MPAHHDRLVLEAQNALDEGDAPHALGLLEQVLKDAPNHRDALLLSAVARAVDGDENGAWEVLGQTLVRHPKDPTVLLARASFLMEHREDAAAALAELVLAADACLALPPAEQRAALTEVHLCRSEAFSMQGAFGDAAGAAKAALELAPDNTVLMLAASSALLDAHDGEGALKLAQDALARNPEDADANHAAGSVLWFMGRTREGLPLLEKAAALSPKEHGVPTAVAPEELKSLVREACRTLPAPVRVALSKVDVRVEDRAPASERALATVPAHYIGTPAPKGSHDPFHHLPEAVVLYRRTLELLSPSLDDLKELALVAFLHEVVECSGMEMEGLDALVPQ